jgi:putative amino-acid transport system substrate-binding protein
MKKRVLAGLMVAVMATTMLIGCENKSNDETTTTEDKTIVVACSDAAQPYSYVEDGEHKGFEVDMWNEIAKRTGYEVTMETMGFSSIFGSVDSGKVDVAGNFFGKSDDRLEKYNASISYGIDGVSAAVLDGNTEIQSADDLKGKKVAVAEGAQGQAVAEGIASDYGFKITVFGDGTSGVQDLSLERCDAWIDSDITLAFDAEKAGVKVRILEPQFVGNEVGYFFKKNDEVAEKKLADVNKVLKEMLADGTIKEISEKWFYTDVTKTLN